MTPRTIETLVRRITHRADESEDAFVTREWIVTNGLGGYACGTIAGIPTRRYHGLLAAALPNPLGRTMMLNHLEERLTLADGTSLVFGGVETSGSALRVPGRERLVEFRLEAGLPVWRFDIGGLAIERRIVLPYRQNTSVIRYALVDGDGAATLELRPAVHFRSHDAPVSEPLEERYALEAEDGRYVLRGGDELPPLQLRLEGDEPALALDGRRLDSLLYRVEEARGYAFSGALWSPGAFTARLAAGRPVTLVASTEPTEVLEALTSDDAFRVEHERRRRLLASAAPAAREGIGGELVLAADQFLIEPAGRVAESARARALGDEVRTVIAGYHWFTDWGRDTMISLEGLTLTTGRWLEAGYILRTFAHYVRDGLIPNMIPEGRAEGLYHTADATLWFFHAVERYVETTGDRWTLRLILPTLREIVARHVHGTHFGIRVDPRDGLLVQGEEGYQLTWMDAKCDGWVVTPRRGKAVEINALWYNALMLLERWEREERGAAPASELADRAARARESFNARFWHEDGGHLFDVVDGPLGDDPSCRPNQVFAISLDHPVLDPARWRPVLDVVRARLLTPVGLRSLAPGEPDYKATYHGDLRTRDAAYHQGTVWGWLIGPFVDAWLRAYPDDRAGARRVLEAFPERMSEFGVGSIAEIFDAEPPFTSRGCIAQAWSVAEVLRCWVKTAG
ncbi:MAG TPA: amylo-alpha-1,6-glucosidase [Gemmatimonadaceae bacterium]